MQVKGKDKYLFTDLVDIEEVRELFESFYRTNGLVNAIVDVDNNVLIACGWQDICTKFHRVNEGSLAQCKASDSYIKEHLREGKYVEYKCRSGLWDAAYPIIVEGEHLATVFIGQYFYEGEEPDREFFVEQAEKYGFDKEEYLKALDRVPRYTREFTHTTMKAYVSLATLLSHQGLTALKLRKELEVQQKQQKALLRAEERLDLAARGGGVGLWEMDLAGGKEWCSARFLEIFGYKEGEIALDLENFKKVLYPDDKDRVLEALRAAIEDDVPYEISYRIIKKTGEIRWVQALGRLEKKTSGRPVRISGMIRDITERKQVEENLLESKKQFETVIKTAIEGVALAGLDGKIMDVNPALCQILGYSEEELLNMSVRDLESVESALETKEHLKSIAEKKADSFETRYRKKDGSIINVFVRVTVFDSEKGLLAAFVEDITKRKEAQNEARRASQEWEKTFNAVNDIICLLDMECNIIRCNSTMEEFFGAEPGELIGKNCCELVHGEGVPIRGCPFKEMLKTGKRAESFAQIGGLWLDVVADPVKDDSGRITGFVHIIKDVTESKATEIEIARRDERFELAEKAGNVGVWERELETDNIWWSDNVERLFGLEPGSFAGTFEAYAACIYPDDRSRIEQEITESLERGEGFVTEYRIIRADGEVRWMTDRAKVYTDDASNSKKLVGTVTDITELKRSQEEVLEAQKRYKEIFNSSRDGIVFTDADGGFLSANKAYCEMLGYSFDELIGKKDFYDITPRKWREWEKVEVLEKRLFKSGYSGVYEKEYIRKDGTVFPVEISAYAVFGRDGKPEYLWGVVRDISEQLELAKKLSEEKDRLIRTNSIAKVGGWEIDCATKKVNWTEETFKIHEIPVGQVPELEKAIEFFHPDERGRLQEAVQKAMEYGEPYDLELRFITAKGKHLWTRTICEPIEEDGRVVKLNGIFQDITERKKILDSLKEKENYLRVLLKSMFNAFVLFDSVFDEKGDFVSYRFVYINDAFERITGVKNEEVRGKTVHEVWPGTEPEWIKRYGEVAVTGQTQTFEMYHEPTKKLYGCNVYRPWDTNERFCVVFEDITERKASEEKLRKEKRFSDTLLSLLPSLFYVVDENGKILRWNLKMEEVSGYSSEEISEKMVLEFFPGDEKERVSGKIQEVFEKGEASVELDFLSKEGERIPIYFHAVRMEFDDKKCMGGIGVDLSQYKRVEHRFRQVFYNAPFGMMMCEIIRDKDGRAVDFIHLDSNAATEKHTGFSLEDLIGKKASALCSGTVLEELVRKYEVAVMHQEAIHYVQYFDLYDRIIDVTAFPLEDDIFLLNFIDVTKREKAIKDLEDRERLLAQVGVVAKIGGWEMDLRKGGKAKWTKGTYDIVELGYDEQVPGIKEHLEYYLPEYREMIESKMKELLETKRTMKFEAMLKTAKGDLKWCQAIGNVVEEDGKVVKLQGIFQDITERKKVEDALKEHREHLEDLVKSRTKALEEANKELEAFSYSVSHDLRAPLRSMDGFSEIIMEENEDSLNDEAKDYLNRIRSASERMSKLIDDLLMLSRISRRNIARQSVDLGMLMREVIKSLEIDNPGRKIEWIVPKDLHVEGDKDLLTILLSNLIQNAWKFTQFSSPGKVEAGMYEDEGEKIYFIRDNGVGFDMRYVDKLFSPFQRLHSDKEFSGTGIGLATVKRIISKHGGRIWAESEEGKGTTFYFTLP